MSHLAACHAGKWSLFSSLTFLLTCALSCNDPEDHISSPGSFKASAFIEVINSGGQPVTDALVSIIHQENNSPIMEEYGRTDKRGILALRKIDMFSSTYLTVSKEGYFTGSRRFNVSAGKTQVVHITLLEESLIGFFNTSEGGEFNVRNKVRLTFPAHSIATENGQPYDGEVHVYAEPIAADDDKLAQKMPGNLVGINISGQQGVLGSFGMIAVTLKSPSGEHLQVLNGSTIEMKMRVPSSHLAHAPQTIPMWYFDENNGYWKEEGSAALIGSEYVAQLSHFTFWNCDDWFELVKWGATFTYENGKPASQVEVCITVASLGLQACDYTDNNGFIYGSVPANEKLLVQVSPPMCNTIFSNEYGPYSDSVLIGNIVIHESNRQSTIHGIGLQCNGNPIINGCVITRVNSKTRFDFLDTGTGAFNISILDCDQSDIHVITYDLNNNKESHPVILDYAENINAGSIVACEDNDEFIRLSAPGLVQNYYFIFPMAYTFEAGETTILSSDSLQTYTFYAPMHITGPGSYSNEFCSLSFDLKNGHRAISSSLTINVSYFGGLNDYISGTFTGTLVDVINTNQTGKEYPFHGEFNVLLREW